MESTEKDPNPDNSGPESTKPKKKLAMHWQILLSMLLAVPTIALLGYLRDGVGWEHLSYITGFIDLLGSLFLKLLKMIIMPLIFASVVMSIAGFDDLRSLRRLSLKTILYYGTTTMFAVAIGVVAVNLVNPGEGMDLATQATSSKSPMGAKELILAMVPDNVFHALSSNSSILSVIVFAVSLGVGIATLGKPARPLRDFFSALDKVMMKLTEWVMALAPVGVWAIVVTTGMSVDGVDVLRPLAAYSFTVIGALLFHAAVVIPAIYFIFTRRNPLIYLRAMNAALLTALSTASSTATLPLTLRSTELRGGVSPRVGGFVLPLGATVNMDGTALYEAVAAIFIAQAFGIHLAFDAQLLIFATATLAAIGAAGVPSAGLVTLLIVLEVAGLPAEGYGLIVVVDRLLDMCRTTVNVWGDAVGAAVLAHTEGELSPVDLEADVMGELHT